LISPGDAIAHARPARLAVPQLSHDVLDGVLRRRRADPRLARLP
jgi:hypothetical protein